MGWEPVLGSFVGRVEGVPTGALLDPEHPTVAWFGSRQAELQTVQDLQEAIGEYAVLGRELRAALEADRTGRPDEPPWGPGPPQPVRPQHPSTGSTLLEPALLVAILVVIVVLALVAVVAGGPNR
ncbi:MAG TPA: hypothetical protein VJ140_09870 [Actinomycetota bacterium]|nr:hypothetical protein [Actinomycetota bacterium]